jgi:nucleoside-diphosphate-sugar epimerase
MEQEDEIGPVNLGNTEEMTVKELAELVIAALPGTGSRLRLLSLPEDDPTQRCPQLDRARKLGFQNRVPLDVGLKRTIAWIRDQAGMPARGSSSAR